MILNVSFFCFNLLDFLFYFIFVFVYFCYIYFPDRKWEEPQLNTCHCLLTWPRSFSATRQSQWSPLATASCRSSDPSCRSARRCRATFTCWTWGPWRTLRWEQGLESPGITWNISVVLNCFRQVIRLFSPGENRKPRNKCSEVPDVCVFIITMNFEQRPETAVEPSNQWTISQSEGRALSSRHTWKKMTSLLKCEIFKSIRCVCCQQEAESPSQEVALLLHRKGFDCSSAPAPPLQCTWSVHEEVDTHTLSFLCFYCFLVFF